MAAVTSEPGRSPKERALAVFARFADKPRQALVLAVALALVFGFIPAHLYAGMAEESKYELILKDVEVAQAGALTDAQYKELPELRAAAVDRMKSARIHIVIMSLLIWCGAGAAIIWVVRRKLIPAAAGR